MGWVYFLGFVAFAAGALFKFAHLPRPAINLALATLLIGVAGYAWQGQPDLAGQPARSTTDAAAPEDGAAVATRRAMSGRFGGQANAIDFAETLARLGMTQASVVAVRTQLRRDPGSSNLWVALGNALVAHGNGLVSPAARFAFARAAALSPESPLPSFSLALAHASAGDTDEAARIWRDLLKRAPVDASWRKDVEVRLATVGG